MLNVFEANKGRVGDFKSYEELSEFIMKKSFFWSFITHTPTHVKQICSLKNPHHITLSETKALEKCLGLIEMRRGNKAPLRQIVMTPEVDVGALRKIWCMEYSEAQHYTVFEITLHKDTPILLNPPQQEFSLTTLPIHQSERLHHD